MKVCSTCEKEKKLTEFHVNKNNIDGRAYYCKECIKNRRKETSGVVSSATGKRKEIMMQTDRNKELVYKTCKDKSLSAKDLAALLGFTFHQTAAYLNILEENNHLEKIKFYSKPKRCWIAQYKSTDLVYKPRTENQVIEQLEKSYGGRSALQFGEGKFDELIANNPNLRKIKLFEEKDNDYFRQPLKKSGKTTIGSTFSVYENFSD